MDRKVKSAIILISFLFCTIIFGVILIASNSKKDLNTNNIEGLKKGEEKYNSSKADSIVAFAKSLMGTPYKYGSCTRDGFDCSGFVYYVFSKFNVKISRSSYTMAEEGVEIDSSMAKKGDLIFFRGTDLSDTSVGHAGIIISSQGMPLEFIHSSSSAKNNGVVITKLNSSHYRERFVKIKRVLK